MEIECSKCEAPVNDSEQYCTSCGFDMGCPNVRQACTPEEHDALAERESNARAQAVSASLEFEYDAFLKAIAEHSGVVVSVPAQLARSLVSDSRKLYQNYETLVGAEIRRPAPLKDDSHRAAVGGWLFGHNAKSIVYGVMSLTNQGLPTYGNMFFRLRPIAIQHRVSFLECNSYAAAEQHGMSDPLPLGMRAGWDFRHWLAAAKLGGRACREQGLQSWQSLLLVSDGKNRNDDDFIEAHIFGTINLHSTQSIEHVPINLMARTERLDARITLDLFKKHIETRGYK